MKIRQLQKNQFKPSLIALGLCFSIGASTFAQERTDEVLEDFIPLKYRTSIADVDKVNPTDMRDYSYLILHFEDELVRTNEITALGIKPINYLDQHSIYASVPVNLDLTTLPSFEWATTLLPSDKINTNIFELFTRSRDLPVLIYLPSDMHEAEIDAFSTSLGLDLFASTSLPDHVLLATIDEVQLSEIAESNLVSWITPAPSRAISGDHFHFCGGAMTPFGPQAEFSSPAKYVLQGSDWDGAGLGCADLTYHFENGTPDIAGNAEEGIVESAMDLWMVYAGLTFTETATVGLANSIDIKWASGSHGDGNSFDGPSGTLAHAFYPQYGGELHFDEAENWVTGSSGGINLYAVAVHELGHSLGLNHSGNSSAVMAPFYAGSISGLHSDDIAGIRAIYSTTPCGVSSYCDSKGSNSTYEWLEEAIIAGTSKTTGNNDGYADFTGGTAIPLTVGASNSVTLKPGFSSTIYTEFWRIWIDYNKNNVFDASELVYSGTGTSTVTGAFTVPSGLSGTTRMRISMKYDSAPTACETFSYGEVEDYTVSLNPPVLSYCSSNGSNSTYEWISRVQIDGLYNASGDDGGYKDNTGLLFTAKTGSNSVTVTPGFSSTSYMEYWRIWIDLNQNGTFDASELVFTGSGSAVVSGTMTVPSGYVGVTTRMRVSMKYDGTPTACETFSYGEVEDYTVTIATSSIVADLLVGEVTTNNFVLYPNPVIDNVLFIQSSTNNANYTIYDASGRLVNNGILNENKIDITSLSTGHYVIHLVSENKSSTLQFIKR